MFSFHIFSHLSIHFRFHTPIQHCKPLLAVAYVKKNLRSFYLPKKLKSNRIAWNFRFDYRYRIELSIIETSLVRIIVCFVYDRPRGCVCKLGNWRHMHLCSYADILRNILFMSPGCLTGHLRRTSKGGSRRHLSDIARTSNAPANIRLWDISSLIHCQGYLFKTLWRQWSKRFMFIYIIMPLLFLSA
jgi:hypothetical protein